MLDWFLLTCGGAALYAAGKWLHARASSAVRGKQQLHKGKYGQPLRLVVQQCEARWFLQELKLAMDGDAEAMVRVAHMLMAGYGTQQDHSAAAQWMRQAWAIQNYKEPAHLHDMLDVRDSAIPALNEATSQHSANSAAALAACRAGGNSSSSSSTGGSQQGPSSSTGGSHASAAAASGRDAGRVVGSGSKGSSFQSEPLPAAGSTGLSCQLTTAEHGARYSLEDCVLASKPTERPQHQQREMQTPPQQLEREQELNNLHHTQQLLQQQQQQQQHIGLIKAARLGRKQAQQRWHQKVAAAVSGLTEQQQQQQRQPQARLAAPATANAATYNEPWQGRQQ